MIQRLTFLFILVFGWSHLGAAQSSDIRVTLRLPFMNQQTFSGQVRVAVSIESTYEITEVRAKIDHLDVAMTYSEKAYCVTRRCPGYVADIPLSSLQQGRKQLVVTASDGQGNSNFISRSFVYDNDPVLTVSAPLEESATLTGHLPISAQCQDPGGACSISVSVSPDTSGHDEPYCPSYNRRTVLRGGSLVESSINLTSFKGQSVSLCFSAKDASNNYVRVIRKVFVEANTGLKLLDEAPGLIADIDETHLLYLTGKRPKIHTWKTLTLRHRQDGTDTLVLTDGQVEKAYRTAAGVVILTRLTDRLSKISYWTPANGLVELDSTFYPDSLKVTDSNAIWSKGPFGKHLYRFQFATDEKELITDNAKPNAHLSDDGSITFATADTWLGDCTQAYDFNIQRYINGTFRQLTNDRHILNDAPKAGNQWVVYKKARLCEEDWSIAIHDGSQEIILYDYSLKEPFTRSGYYINGDWIAWTQPGGNGTAQVWTRNPEGEKNQITGFGKNSYLDGLASDGQLTLRNGSKRYLSRNGELIAISSTLGETVEVNGRLVVLMGRQVFGID